jgi:site-specific DNA-adenine methylase
VKWAGGKAQLLIDKIIRQLMARKKEILLQKKQI